MEREVGVQATRREPEVAMVEPEDVARMRALSRLGWGTKRIAREVGVSRNTVRRYVRDGAEAQQQERTGRRSLSEVERRQAEELFTGEADGNAVVVQELLSERGVKAHVRTVQRAVSGLRQQVRTEQLATVRFETPPGEQMQADIGMRRVRIAGEMVRVIFFVAVLSFSRRIFVKLLSSERLEEWLSGFAAAFNHFGGVPVSVLLDNAGALVIGREGNVVRLSPGFVAFLRDWDVMARVCRPYRARTKGKTENGVGYVKKNALAGRSFASMAELESWLSSWCLRADERIHGTTGERPAARFARAEKAALKPLPMRALPTRERRLKRRVASDCLVDVDTVRYSVPHRLVKQHVEVLVLEREVVIYHDGAEVARHDRSTKPKSRVIDRRHYEGLWRPWEKTREVVGVSLEEAFPGRTLADYEAVVTAGRS